MLSNVLKKKRKELGLTLLDIAKYVGVTEATVQRWESGNIKNVRYEKVALLCELLHVTPAEIMGWEDYIKISKDAQHNEMITDKTTSARQAIYHEIERMSDEQFDKFQKILQMFREMTENE